MHTLSDVMMTSFTLQVGLEVTEVTKEGVEAGIRRVVEVVTMVTVAKVDILNNIFHSDIFSMMI